MPPPTCELSRIYGPLTAQVPDGPPGHPEFTFHAGVLPEPPPTLSTDRILFRKLHHDYNGWYRADALWMYLRPKKCRELGVYLMACAFHGPAQDTTLEFTHPDSAIRRFVFPAAKLSLDKLPVGLSTVPYGFCYFPSKTAKHPWMHDTDTSRLPVLGLTNADDCVVTEDHWRDRDTVQIWAPAPGTIRLAELFVNAGCSWNDVNEYALEGDAGYRSVGPMSAELRIFLPGNFGWLWEGDDIPPVPEPANQESKTEEL
jgi:hypothetical protein